MTKAMLRIVDVNGPDAHDSAAPVAATHVSCTALVRRHTHHVRETHRTRKFEPWPRPIAARGGTTSLAVRASPAATV